MGVPSQGAGWRGQWIENCQEEESGIRRGIWLNQPDRILAGGRPGWPDVPWGMVGNEGSGQISRVGDSG